MEGLNLSGNLEDDEIPDQVSVDEVMPKGRGPAMNEAEQMETADRLDLLVREASDAVNKIVGSNEATLSDLWDEGHRYYMGAQHDHAPASGMKQETLNKVQQIVITHTSAQTEQSPRIRFLPVETSGEPRAVYIKPRGIRKLKRAGQGGANAATLPPISITGGMMGMTMEQLSGMAPIDMDQYEALVGVDGMPGLLAPDDFWVVDDKMLGKVAQDIWERQWDRSWGDVTWAENTFLSNCMGHAPLLMEWDPDQNNMTFHNAHVRNVLIDPLARRIEDARYLIFDQVLPLEQAVQDYPEHAALLESNADTGIITRSGASDYRLGGPYQETNFERDMVTLRTAWERGERIAMTEDEALQAGAVKSQPVSEAELVGAGLIDMGMDGGVVFVADGSPATPDSPQWPKQLALPDGTPVSPVDQAWPTKPVVWVTVVLVEAQRVIRSEPCPYLDMPWAWPINIPIPYSPYGLGEPNRLRPSQDFINRMASIISNTTRFGAYPQEYMPRSLVDQLSEQVESPNSRPGRVIAIDDINYEKWFLQGKQTGFGVPAPQINEATMSTMTLFLGLIDTLGGNVDVLNGRPPSNQMSGQALATLTTNAKGPLALKSRFAEEALKRVAMITVDAAVRFLPDAVWARYFNSYPPQVLAFIRKEIGALTWDISVEIASGRGANKQIEASNGLQQFQAQLISKTTAQEKAGVNVDLEAQREQEEAIRMAKTQTLMAAAMPQTQAPAGGPPGEKPKGTPKAG